MLSFAGLQGQDFFCVNINLSWPVFILRAIFSHNPWHIVLSACKYWENPQISVFLLYSVWDNGSGLWTYIPFALVTFSFHRYEGLIEQAPWPSAQSHIQHTADPLINLKKKLNFLPMAKGNDYVLNSVPSFWPWLFTVHEFDAFSSTHDLEGPLLWLS